MLVITVLGRWWRDEQMFTVVSQLPREFKVSLGYVSPCLLIE